MKLKRIVFSMLALFGAVVLVACGASSSTSNSTETADYQLLTKGQSDIRNHFEYQGDQVILMETKTTILYSALGVDTQEAAEKLMSDPEVTKWDGVNGIKHEIEYKEDRLIETTSIDLNQVDLDELNELMPIQTADGEKAKYISYKMTKENLKQIGMKEIQDGQFEELK